MRNFSLITSLALASLITVCACTSESTPDPSKDTSDVSIPGNSEAPSASPNETTTEPLGITAEALGITTGAITPNACSVTLNFCDRSGSIGTDCTESGCTLDQARSACESIVTQVGCSQHCNAVTRQGSGPNAPIVETWRVECGGVCCPIAPQGYCGPTGHCCDGIHFNSACPPL